GFLNVVLSGLLSDLPRPVHLVAEAPVANPVGFFTTVLSAAVGPLGVAGAVAVLHPCHCLVHCAGAHVHAYVGLGAGASATRQALGGPEAVRPPSAPGNSHPAGPVLLRAGAAGQVVTRHEVAPWPTKDRRAQPPYSLDDVPPESPFVGQRRALVV